MSYQALVNQKLAFVRVCMQEAEALVEGEQSLKFDALVQGGCFHLYAGYLTYLRELAENYQLPAVDEIESLVDLVDALALAGKTPAESRELQELQVSSSSWLNCLSASYSTILQGQGEGNAPEPLSDSVIRVASEGDKRCNLTNLKAWYQELSSLIARHRESMIEW